jgi:hypothetical protein
MTAHIARGRRHRPGRALAVAATITLLACADEPTGAGIDIAPRIGPTVVVTVSPRALSLVVGDPGAFVARGADARNQTTGASFVWSSADPSIATVGQFDGSVVAVAPGSTTVTATAGALSATGIVTVRPPDPPSTVSIVPNALTLLPGGVDRLVARAVDSTGRVAAASFEWVSANPAIVTVGKTDGMVTAIAPGVATVTVSTGALTATANVVVVNFARSFAFTRTSSSAGRFASDVFIYSGADQRLQALPRSEDVGSIAGAAWSPDGTQLAIERIRTFYGPPEFEWMEYTSDLYIADAATSGTAPWRALTTNGLSRSPSWSPDGRRIAFVEQEVLFSTNHIALIDAAGGAAVRLTRETGYYGRPLWSPDGTRIAFSAWVGSDESRIFIVGADGTRSTAITPAGTNDYDPSWSPDGARLAFIRFREEPAGRYHFDVLVSDVDGRNVRRIASLPEFASAPAWSPDGVQIMFAAGGGLHVMSSDGSALTRITSPTVTTFDGTPSWRR